MPQSISERFEAMTEPVDLVGWDSTVFIDALEKKRGRFEHIEPILQDAEDGKLVIFCSTLAMVETATVKGVSQAESEKMIADIFESDYIHMEAVHRRVAEIARKIVRDHGLCMRRMPRMLRLLFSTDVLCC